MQQIDTALETRWLGRCVFCGKPLSNSDSIEAFAGPICRGKHGHVLGLDALLDPNYDFGRAEELAKTLNLELKLNFFDNDKRLEASNQVLRILSRGASIPEAQTALEILKALGYKAVAALAGASLDVDGYNQASLKKGDLFIHNGRIILKGEYIAKVIEILRKTQGRQWDPISKTNTFPASTEHAKIMLDICSRYYPLCDIEQSVRDLATSTVVVQADTLPVPAPTKSVQIKLDKTGSIKIITPYKKDFVDAIKGQIHWQNRKWDQDLKCWVVNSASIDQAMQIVRSFYNANDIEEDAELKTRLENLEKAAKFASSATVNEDEKIEVNGKPLFPFQCGGVHFLELRGRGLIADQMGLGKTIQVLAALSRNANWFPALVVAPASVKMNWCREIMNWIGHENVSVDVVVGDIAYEIDETGHRCKITGNLNTIKSTDFADIVVINYDILQKHKESLMKMGFNTIIFDESHYLKNYKSKRAKAALELSKNIEHKMLLTGTPIMNRPSELWHQLHILDSNAWPNFFSYARRYCNATKGNYGWDFSGASNLSELNEVLTGNFMVRRLKKDVMKELPSKMSYRVTLDVTQNERVEYDRAVADFKDWAYRSGGHEKLESVLKAETITKMTTLKKLSALAKINSAIEKIEEFVDSEESEQLVVFAHHREVLEKVSNALRAKNIPIATIVGGDSIEHRQKAVESFRDGTSRVIVCSILAAGVGIDGLQVASNMMFLERTWRPGDHDQAEDRIHRIGQEKKCFIQYLDMENSIDEKMANIIDSKKKIAAHAIDGVEIVEDTMIRDVIKWFLD